MIEGKFKGIMIVSDIDGTFLGKGSRVVPENVDAINRFKAEGGLFTLASGRMHINAAAVIPGLSGLLNAPAIMANGTYLYDFSRGETLAHTPMDKALTAEVLRLVRREYPNTGIRVSTLEGFVTDSLSGLIKKDLESTYITNVTVIPYGQWSDDGSEWLKVVIRDEPEVLDGMRAMLESRYPDAFEYSKSSPRFFEFQSAGCTKAAMLSSLKALTARELGSVPRVYACGDFENDIAMLGAADVAICPENALDCVKAIADACLCHCDDGLIAALIAEIAEGKL